MEKKQIPTALFDEYMESISGMQEAETDPFFYARLSTSMQQPAEWVFPLRPAWIVTGLALLLVLNGFMTINKLTTIQNDVAATSSLQSFATAYDLTIQPTY